MTLAHDVYRVMHLAKKEYFFNIIQLRDRQKTNFLKFQNDGKFCALFRKPKNAFDKLPLMSERANMHSIKKISNHQLVDIASLEFSKKAPH